MIAVEAEASEELDQKKKTGSFSAEYLDANVTTSAKKAPVVCLLKQVGEELEWQAMSLYKVQVRQLAKRAFSLGVILRVTNFNTSKPAGIFTTCCNIKKLLSATQCVCDLYNSYIKYQIFP